jgi:hypothetical protein
MSYLRRSKNRRSEDVVGLAGWLFTDLLLGVSLVFLATASFQVAGTNGQGDCDLAERTYFPTPLRLPYTDEKVAQRTIRKQMDDFSVANGLKKYEVAVALVYGYYKPGDDAGDGQRFARDFYNKSLNKADPIEFPKTAGPSLNETQDTNVRFYGGPAGDFIPINGVYVELFFVYNPCQPGT